MNRRIAFIRITEKFLRWKQTTIESYVMIPGQPPIDNSYLAWISDTYTHRVTPDFQSPQGVLLLLNELYKRKYMVSFRPYKDTIVCRILSVAMEDTDVSFSASTTEDALIKAILHLIGETVDGLE